MDNIIRKTAIKFIKKEMKNQISFEAVKECLKRKGYTVMFYKPDEMNEIIEKYNLTEYAKTVDAFTLKRGELKIVFISTSSPVEDKLYLLLHEVGHILLNHLSAEKQMTNFRLQDIEADAFVHTVLNPPRMSFNSHVLLAGIVLLSFTLGVIGATVTSPSSASASNYVYITPSGEKYHNENCVHVNRKTSTAVTEQEAKRTHEPCLVCNP